MGICKDIQKEDGDCCNCCKEYSPMEGYCKKFDDNFDYMNCCEFFEVGEE